MKRRSVARYAPIHAVTPPNTEAKMPVRTMIA